MLLSLEGDEKTGKTSFAYSGPLPIVGFNFDIGEQRALYGGMYDTLFKGLDINIVQYPKDKTNQVKYADQWTGHDITIFRLPPPVQIDSNNPTGFVTLWNYFIGHLGLAVSDDSIRSIVLDTATIARRVKSDAHLEGLNEGRQIQDRRKQLLQIEYGPINDAMRNIYTLMASMDKNFIATHHLTDEYKPQVQNDGSIGSSPTGNKILEGLTGSHRYFDVALQQSIDRQNKIHSKILICGYDTNLQGMELPAGMQNWNGLVSLIEGSLGGRITFDKRPGLV